MKFSASVDVDAPPEEVFARLADFPRYVRRAEAKGARVRVLDAPVFGWIAAFDWNGAARELRGEVVRFDPPRSFTAEMATAGVEGKIDVEVAPLEEARSRVGVRMEWRPVSLGGRILLQSLKLVKGPLEDRFAARVTEFAADTGRIA